MSRSFGPIGGDTVVTRRRMLATSVGLVATIGFAPRIAEAAPAVGGVFPSFSVRALDDRARTERDLRGHRSLVIVMTGTDAQSAIDRWIATAESRLGPGRGNMYAFIALRLGFFIPDAIIRAESRRRAPRYRWANMYIDRDGNFQRQLGLPDGHGTPWAFVVESTGVVSVAVHAPVTHPSAQQVWTQMSTPA